MSSSYHERLIQTVLDKSDESEWNKAVYEWEIDDCIEDDHLQSSCICGKENLRYLFTIRNIKNGSTLFPIGSSCITKFDREELNELTSVKEKLFQLLHAVQNSDYISLNSEFFSRKLLKYLYNDGVFQPSHYNNYDSETDYLFMLSMFNKQTEPTDSQQRKISAIIVNFIKPYLVEQLACKISKSD